ncbi:hypothetical protein ABZ946_23745 [Streptomyces sp. NPDC046324]|uniref:hypothetical protein n=1 Tax=Streptomyces sp. NPDC046324 TaxID=3154915 RepID=UPI003404659A
MDCWEYFIAPDDESAAQVQGFGTRGAFDALPVGNYDPRDAVVEWEGLLAGVTSQSLMEAGEPWMLTWLTNDGTYVFVFSERLQRSLATADRAQLDYVARVWSRLCREVGDDIAEDEAADHLGDVADLARKANDQRLRLYCSVT